ncbi:ATP12 family chaperone protein [Sphingomonas sp.]
MRRFWKDVAVTADGIALDGRPVRTPGRHPLTLPTSALAEAVAEEWRSVGQTVDPRAMPLTGLANAAIDRVAADPEPFVATTARYGESDMLYYRADGPAELVARQARQWDAVLAWARNRYDVHFEVTNGIVHRAQPATTLSRLTEAVAAHSPFALAALSKLVSLTGSLVLTLAWAEDAIDSDSFWQAAELDEVWQAEKWGSDPIAEAAQADRRREFDAATRFFRLLARSGR